MWKLFVMCLGWCSLFSHYFYHMRWDRKSISSASKNTESAWQRTEGVPERGGKTVHRVTLASEYDMIAVSEVQDPSLLPPIMVLHVKHYRIRTKVRRITSLPHYLIKNHQYSDSHAGLQH